MPGAPNAGAPIGGGDIIGGGTPGAPRPGAPITGIADDAVSALPQLRQNFMPGGFSPRHTPQIVGNPGGGAGVWPWAWGPAANELPQFRQNDDPAGLSWPHIEQRIGPLTVYPWRVSQQPLVSGMASGRFATHQPTC
jgi:hypothetical protein